MMLSNLVFASLREKGGRISPLAELTRQHKCYGMHLFQSCEIWGTGNYSIQNGKRKSWLWILICIHCVEDTTRNLESFA